jgi:hypothetical protein
MPPDPETADITFGLFDERVYLIAESVPQLERQCTLFRFRRRCNSLELRALDDKELSPAIRRH